MGSKIKKQNRARLPDCQTLSQPRCEDLSGRQFAIKSRILALEIQLSLAGLIKTRHARI